MRLSSCYVSTHVHFQVRLLKALHCPSTCMNARHKRTPFREARFCNPYCQRVVLIAVGCATGAKGDYDPLENSNRVPMG